MSDNSWRHQAACAQTDPEAFFPENKRSGGWTADGLAALQLCRRCPVQQECLEHALTTNEAFGIWGGTTEEERRRIRRKRGLDADGAGARAHGTLARALRGCGCEACSEIFGVYEDRIAQRLASRTGTDPREAAQ